jgi:hypothetical protein
MFIVIFCLAQALLPDAAALASETEIRALTLALSLFAYILCRLWLHAQSPRTQGACPTNMNLTNLPWPDDYP